MLAHTVSLAQLGQLAVRLLQEVAQLARTRHVRLGSTGLAPAVDLSVVIQTEDHRTQTALVQNLHNTGMGRSTKTQNNLQE